MYFLIQQVYNSICIFVGERLLWPDYLAHWINWPSVNRVGWSRFTPVRRLMGTLCCSLLLSCSYRYNRRSNSASRRKCIFFPHCAIYKTLALQSVWNALFKRTARGKNWFSLGVYVKRAKVAVFIDLFASNRLLARGNAVLLTTS